MPNTNRGLQKKTEYIIWRFSNGDIDCCCLNFTRGKTLTILGRKHDLISSKCRIETHCNKFVIVLTFYTLYEKNSLYIYIYESHLILTFLCSFIPVRQQTILWNLMLYIGIRCCILRTGKSIKMKIKGLTGLNSHLSITNCTLICLPNHQDPL